MEINCTEYAGPAFSIKHLLNPSAQLRPILRLIFELYSKVLFSYGEYDLFFLYLKRKTEVICRNKQHLNYNMKVDMLIILFA